MGTLLNTLFHLLMAALLFLLWKMWEDVIMDILLRARVGILGKTKVKVHVGESKEVL